MLALKNETFQKFNYDITTLSKNSHKKCLALCSKCQSIKIMEYRAINPEKICKLCFQWNSNDDSFLIENHTILSLKELAKKLNRTVGSVENRITKLKIGTHNNWTMQEIELLKKLYSVENLTETAKSLYRSKSAIKQMARILGLQYKTIWKKEEINILKENYGLISVSKIQKLIPNRNIQTILSKAFSLKLKSNIVHSIYDWNKAFFAEPQKISSYWAGFIAADGYVGGKKHSEMEIQINEKDEKLLIQFKSDIKYTGEIRKSFKKAQTGSALVQKESTTCRILLTSLNMCQDLFCNYNITNRKTFTFQPPNNLTFKNSLAFIKGYIDGDGCITISKKGFITIEILGTEKFLCWVKEIIMKIVPKYQKSNVTKYKNIYRYRISGKTAICVAKHLKTILPNHGLERKWGKFDPL